MTLNLTKDKNGVIDQLTGSSVEKNITQATSYDVNLKKLKFGKNNKKTLSSKLFNFTRVRL